MAPQVSLWAPLEEVCAQSEGVASAEEVTSVEGEALFGGEVLSEEEVTSVGEGAPVLPSVKDPSKEASGRFH